jgi:hypothetical protein
MTDPDVIYLEPECCADPDTGRCWCKNDAFHHCEDGHKATKYVRADRIEALETLLTEIRDLTVERRDHATMDEAEAVMRWTLWEGVLDDIKKVMGG